MKRAIRCQYPPSRLMILVENRATVAFLMHKMREQAGAKFALQIV